MCVRTYVRTHGRTNARIAEAANKKHSSEKIYNMNATTTTATAET